VGWLGLARRSVVPLTGAIDQYSRELLIPPLELQFQVSRTTTAHVRCGSNASVELSRHVGFTSDSGRIAARQRTDASGQQQKSPLYSITASALASSVAGTSRPSALPVLRLMTVSYLVVCL
jgi:hypothetical protein